MKIRTSGGEKLKRLAREFADATAEMTWLGACDPCCHEEIKERYKVAKKKLYKAIDDLFTTHDTPRAVEDML